MSATIRYTYRAEGADSLENIRHIHGDEAEILYIKKGEGTLVLGDRILPMQENTLYFISPGMLHCTVPFRREKYERSVIGLSREVLTSLLPLADYDGLFGKLLDTAAVTLDAEGSAEMERLLPLFARDELRHRVRAFFSLLELADRRGDRLPASRNKVTVMTEYIRDHLSEPISLDGMSAALFISKYYMCHLFKRTTGISITAYILLQRISLSKRLLTTTALSITEIALMSGFSDAAYFSRAFRRSVGMAPSEYRRENK